MVMCYNIDMKICKDGRIWGQSNKEAGDHLGVLSKPRLKSGNRGKWVRTETFRSNLSEKRKGKLNPIYGHVGEQNPIFGRHLSKETRKKLQIAHIGRHHTIEVRRKMAESKIGKQNPAWKGGVSVKHEKIRKSIEGRLWREAVFARDNWTCQKCGKQGGRLNAHHIKSFKDYLELRLAIDNGETLCLKCHKLTDNYSNKGK